MCSRKEKRMVRNTHFQRSRHLVTTSVASPGCFVCEEQCSATVQEEKSRPAQLLSRSLSRTSPLAQEYQRQQLEFSISFGAIYISEGFLELNNKGFLTFKIWTCFVYFLETNIPLQLILDMTYFLHIQALDWWLAGDCSVVLKSHEVSLVFFSPCCKNFYSFLRREQLSK